MLTIELFAYNLCNPNILDLKDAYKLKATCRSMSQIVDHLRKSESWKKRAVQQIEIFHIKYKPILF